MPAVSGLSNYEPGNCSNVQLLTHFTRRDVALARRNDLRMPDFATGKTEETRS